MANRPYPEKVVNFNVYYAGQRQLGVASEITLPTLNAMVQTLSGAGMAGEIETANPGHFGPMQVEITWKAVIDRLFTLAQYRGATLTFRASQQHMDFSTGESVHRGLKITVKGSPKNIELGRLSAGLSTDSKNVLEVTYIKVEENGKEILELDKLAMIYRLNGVDQLAEIKSQL